MGFFSAVKKWWKGDTEEAQTPEVVSEEVASQELVTEEVASEELVAEETADKEAEAPSEEVAPAEVAEPVVLAEVEQTPEAEVEPIPAVEVEPTPEPAPVEATPAEVVPEVTPEAVSDEATPVVTPEEVPAEVVEPEPVEIISDIQPAIVEEIPQEEPAVVPAVEDKQEVQEVIEEVEEVQPEAIQPEPIPVVEEIPAAEEIQAEEIQIEEPQAEEVQPEIAPAVEEIQPEIAQPEIIEEPAPIEEPAAVETPAPIEEPAPISPRDMPSVGITEQIEPWQAELTLALRQAEPRLSIWLSHVLDGVEEVDENLWTRVRFFFKALEVPEQEAENFVSDFSRWLKAMDYNYVDDFRSELQYRLALALDLEDEEDERSRLMLKLSEGLARTREHIGRRIDSLLASHSRIDEAFWEELEEILITADVGYEPSMELVGRLRRRAQSAGTDDPEKFRDLLREELEEIFKGQRRIAAVNPPEVVLMIGVNGVGKTTTIAKLAYRARMQGKKVLIAAADTFRAAACEQLQVWAERVGAGFHTKGANADPAAVAYEAMDIAVAEGYDILFVDTAGRLHTKTNLMEELHKIRKVLGKKHAGAPHRSILVIDATTGQNALSQTKLFGEACGIDEIILTKLDGTAKGGVVVAVAMQFGIPITYIGLGEKMEDLRPFDGGDFALALLGLDSKGN